MSLRVTGGALRGRSLRSPPGDGVRPTSGRVREALFSIVGQRLHGARVLDLCAGAGTLGLEAGSRGAARVVFVECARSHLPVLRSNSEILVDCSVDVITEDARAAPRRLLARGESFDLVLLDPPYGGGLACEILDALHGSSALFAPGACLVAETDARELPRAQVGPLQRDPGRRYGDTVLWLYREAATPT